MWIFNLEDCSIKSVLPLRYVCRGLNNIWLVPENYTSSCGSCLTFTLSAFIASSSFKMVLGIEFVCIMKDVSSGQFPEQKGFVCVLMTMFISTSGVSGNFVTGRKLSVTPGGPMSLDLCTKLKNKWLLKDYSSGTKDQTAQFLW